MSDLASFLLSEAKNDSQQPVKLKEAIVYNTYTKEFVPYSKYTSKCNPESMWSDEVGGYRLSDSCGNELYTKDKIECAIYYDKIQLLMFKKSIDVIDDPLRYIRRIADEKFLEIWDDEDEREEIDRLVGFVEELALAIEQFNLYDMQ